MLRSGQNAVSPTNTLNCGALIGTGIGAADIQLLLVSFSAEFNRGQKAFFVDQALVNKASNAPKYMLIGT